MKLKGLKTLISVVVIFIAAIAVNTMAYAGQINAVIQETGEEVTVDQFHPEPLNNPEIDWIETQTEDDVCKGNPYCNPNDWK